MIKICHGQKLDVFFNQVFFIETEFEAENCHVEIPLTNAKKIFQRLLGSQIEL